MANVSSPIQLAGSANTGPSVFDLRKRLPMSKTITITTNSSHKRNPKVALLSGATSGVLSCVLLQPLDMVKTRVQASNLAGLSRSPFSVARTVMQANGSSYLALWQGLRPSLMRTVPGVGMYFCSLNTLKSFVVPLGEDGKPTALQNFAMGASARVAVGFTLLPFTVVKTRVESGLFQYGGVGAALRTIRQTEGVRGLYSGGIATAMRDAPFSGFYLLFYSQAQKTIKESGLLTKYAPIATNICSGLFAGSLASLITQPMDVIKTRVQIAPARSLSFGGAVMAIVKEGGVTALFSGLAPRFVRRTLVSSICWTVYEEISPLYERLLSTAPATVNAIA